MINLLIASLTKLFGREDEALIGDISASPSSSLYSLQYGKNKSNIFIIFPFFILPLLQRI